MRGMNPTRHSSLITHHSAEVDVLVVAGVLDEAAALVEADGVVPLLGRLDQHAPVTASPRLVQPALAQPLEDQAPCGELVAGGKAADVRPPIWSGHVPISAW